MTRHQHRVSGSGRRVAAEPEGSQGGSPVRAIGPVLGSRSAAETMAVAAWMTVPGCERTHRGQQPGWGALYRRAPRTPPGGAYGPS